MLQNNFVLTFDDEEFGGMSLTDKIRHDVMIIERAETTWVDDARYIARIMQNIEELERQHEDALRKIARLENHVGLYKSRAERAKRAEEAAKVAAREAACEMKKRDVCVRLTSEVEGR